MVFNVQRISGKLAFLTVVPWTKSNAILWTIIKITVNLIWSLNSNGVSVNLDPRLLIYRHYKFTFRPMTYSDSLRINETVIFVHFHRYISFTFTMVCKQIRLRNETFLFSAKYLRLIQF
jgi:hypothetical protein